MLNAQSYRKLNIILSIKQFFDGSSYELHQTALCGPVSTSLYQLWALQPSQLRLLILCLIDHQASGLQIHLTMAGPLGRLAGIPLRKSKLQTITLSYPILLWLLFSCGCAPSFMWKNPKTAFFRTLTKTGEKHTVPRVQVPLISSHKIQVPPL